MARSTHWLGLLSVFSVALLTACGGGGGGGGGNDDDDDVTNDDDDTAPVIGSRTEAWALVEDRLIDPLDEEGKILTSVFAPTDPLPAGTVIGPATDLLDVENYVLLPQDAITLGDRAWFFMVDPDFTARMRHDLILAFVHEDGRLVTWTLNVWPVINGTPFLPGIEDRANSDLRLYPEENPYEYDIRLSLPDAVERREMLSQAETATEPNCCEGSAAWLINGGGSDASNFQKDLQKVKNMLTGKMGFSAEDITQTEGAKSPTEANRWREIARGINQKAREKHNGKCLCELFIYYSGHGEGRGFETDGDGQQTGPLERSIQQPWLNGGNDDKAKNPPAVTFEDFVGKKPGEDGTGGVDGILSQICARKVRVVIDACYAGALVNELKFSATRKKMDLCMDEITVEASTSDTKQSGSSRWTGGYYTSALVDAINAQSDPGANIGEALDAAHGTAKGSTVGVWSLLELFHWNIGDKQDPKGGTFPITDKPEDCCPCCSCGDGIVTDPPEKCETDGDCHGDGEYCDEQCQCMVISEECGDGTVGEGEECEQDSDCHGEGETCDSGCNCLPPPPPECGDGAVDPGESCDPAATPSGCEGGAACQPDCSCETAFTCPPDSFWSTLSFQVFSDTWNHNLYDNLPTGTPLDIFFGVGPTNFTLSGEPAYDIITITGTPVLNGPGGFCQFSGSGSGIFAGYPNSPAQLIDMRIFPNDTITGQYQVTPSAYPGKPIIYSFTGVINP